MDEDPAADALERLKDLDAALRKLTVVDRNLADAHRSKVFAVRYQVEAWERSSQVHEAGQAD